MYLSNKQTYACIKKNFITWYALNLWQSLSGLKNSCVINLMVYY